MMEVLSRILLLIIFASSAIINAGDEPQSPPAAPQISQAIAGLGSEKFEDREESQTKLIEAGKEKYDLVLEECIRKYFDSKDPEVRLRLKAVMRAIVLERNFHRKAFIGINMNPSPSSPLKIGNDTYMPVDIITVTSDFPAEKAGIKAGDRILKIDDKACDGAFASNEIVEYISAKKPGTRLVFLIRSGDETVTREVVTTERPDLPNEPTGEQQKDDFFSKWFREKVKPPEKQRRPEKEGQERN